MTRYDIDRPHPDELADMRNNGPDWGQCYRAAPVLCCVLGVIIVGPTAVCLLIQAVGRYVWGL